MFSSESNKLQKIYKETESSKNVNDKLKKKQIIPLAKNVFKKKHTITLLDNFYYNASDYFGGRFANNYQFSGLRERDISKIYINFYVSTLDSPVLETESVLFFPRFNYLWKVKDGNYELLFIYNGQFFIYPTYTPLPLYLNLELITYNPITYYEISNNKT